MFACFRAGSQPQSSVAHWKEKEQSSPRTLCSSLQTLRLAACWCQLNSCSDASGWRSSAEELFWPQRRPFVIREKRLATETHVRANGFWGPVGGVSPSHLRKSLSSGVNVVVSQWDVCFASFQSLDYDRCINEPYLEVLESLDNRVGRVAAFRFSHSEEKEVVGTIPCSLGRELPVVWEGGQLADQPMVNVGVSE